MSRANLLTTLANTPTVCLPLMSGAEWWIFYVTHLEGDNMDRVLALQKLSTEALDQQVPVGNSTQSLNCSTESTACSATSINCGGDTTNW